MARHQLSLESLAHLDDGRINEAVRQAIKRVVADCNDRPAVTEARKVNLQIECVPVPDETGQAYNAKFRFQVKDHIPTRKSRIYEAAMNKDGLVFNDLSDDAIDQQTFPELDQDQE